MTDLPDDETVAPLRHTGHLIRRAQQVHQAVWARDVSADVSSVQYAALAVLERRPGASQAELGAELSLDRSTIADLVSRMIRRGLLTREQDPADRRRKVLTLTDAGREAYAALVPRVDAIEPIVTGGLSAAERSELRRLLRTVLAAADEEGLIG